MKNKKTVTRLDIHQWNIHVKPRCCVSDKNEVLFLSWFHFKYGQTSYTLLLTHKHTKNATRFGIYLPYL